MPTDTTRLHCPHCSRSQDYSGERPRFCGYCGKPFVVAATPATEAATLPPAPDPEAATLAPAPTGNGAADEVPSTVGGYRLLRRLGGGGMGSVYEAEDPTSGRHVALKLVLPEFAQTPEAVERFRQEGCLASSLVHPRCVFVHAADEDTGRPYIVMELMPGQTLDDLVQKDGPLAPEAAITRILDVIDGLYEAHQRGLVHRDVKPSNCFLEEDGRVKVGDFGLAKSLVSDSKLTRTGTFLGTPLFAAPEQIKLEAVDAQSDVYSVAATLYFLLAGRAPFQTGDALATLARIVSDEPPPLRSVRPEIPKALDRVVLRGLERDRKRRYRDLDEFRRALLPLLPAKPSIGGIGLRFVAHLIDGILITILGATLGYGVFAPAGYAGLLPTFEPLVAKLVYEAPLGLLICLLYYGIFEGRWGWSPGKRLLRLRVGTADGTAPPGIGRAVLREGILYTLISASSVVLVPAAFLALNLPADLTQATPEQQGIVGLIGLGNLVVTGLGFVLFLSTMRARNGYRGLHEVLSGTRTFRLQPPLPPARQVLRGTTFEPPLAQPAGLPERVGAFRILGTLHWSDAERTLLGEDPQLGRRVWLCLRPADGPEVEAAGRDVNRGTRVRWVAGGTEGDWRWDAFLAPDGVPLTVLTGGKRRLSWAAVRPVLEDLTDELTAACGDGTLPPSLAAHQVWVRPNGRVQLLGTLLATAARQVAADRADAEPVTDADDEERALAFLRRVAVTALEGAPRPAEDTTVRAPLPVHVEQLLQRLLGGPEPFASLDDWQRELEATRERATEVSRLRRFGHMALNAVLLHIPCFWPSLMLVFSFGALMEYWTEYRTGGHSDAAGPAAVVCVLCALNWIGWAFVFRGGYAFWRGGVALRRADGWKATRLQCAYRALLIWGPAAAVFCAALAVAHQAPGLAWLYFGIWGVGLVLLLTHPVLALRSPNRSLLDRLAGVYLVPD